MRDIILSLLLWPGVEGAISLQCVPHETFFFFFKAASAKRE